MQSAYIGRYIQGSGKLRSLLRTDALIDRIHDLRQCLVLRIV